MPTDYATGIALTWFRTEEDDWATYRDFEDAFTRRFSAHDLQFMLQEEIIRRTQGEDEDIIDFLTCIRALLDRVKPRLSTAQKLDQVHRNLLPSVQHAIPRQNFQSFLEFEDLAVRLQTTYDAERYYQPPPPPNQSAFPEYAYRSSRSDSRSRDSNYAVRGEIKNATVVPTSERREGGTINVCEYRPLPTAYPGPLGRPPTRSPG